MEPRKLTEKESKKIAELMSKAVKNKEHPHPADIRRAAVVLYTVNESGFTLMDSDLLDLMNKLDESGDDHYSATMREILGPMASAYNHLVYGLNNSKNEVYKFKE
jgi:hypothetical protein